MAEIARGERIAELRELKGLTQDEMPFVLKEFNDGEHVASRRAYQDWEAGKGIKPKNARVLARFFEVAVDEIATRELAAPGLNGDGPANPYAEQLDRIEEKVDELLRRTAPAEPGPPETGSDEDGGIPTDLPGGPGSPPGSPSEGEDDSEAAG